MQHLSKGKFIVFEGLDGAGTSTQVLLLRDWLTAREIRCLTTKEPSNGPFGAEIRKAIEGRTRVDPRALALAFAADRTDHLFHWSFLGDESGEINAGNRSLRTEDTGVDALLKRGVWVVCDRYVVSSYAYQLAQGLNLEWLQEINRFAIDPNLTIWIDTEVEECFRRIGNRTTHLELFDSSDRLSQVREAYLTALASWREHLGYYLRVDGMSSSLQVHSKIVHEVEQLYKETLTTALQS